MNITGEHGREPAIYCRLTNEVVDGPQEPQIFTGVMLDM